MKRGYVYILTNKDNKVLYVGVTSDIVKRIYQHKNKMAEGFTSRYNLTKLVYYEVFDEISDAITREKQLKKGSRSRKLDLINCANPKWDDLYSEITGNI